MLSSLEMLHELWMWSNVNYITITGFFDTFSAMVSVFLLINNSCVINLWIQVTTTGVFILLSFHSLWVQKVHLVQRVHCHRRVPERRQNASSNGIVVLDKTFFACGFYRNSAITIGNPGMNFITHVHQVNISTVLTYFCALWWCAVTYRRSWHSLKTSVSTQTLHASLSLVSSNSFLTTNSSRSL